MIVKFLIRDRYIYVDFTSTTLNQIEPEDAFKPSIPLVLLPCLYGRYWR